jgi:hypothetical protein
LDFFDTSLVIEPSPREPSGDAGLLPIRQFDERIGVTRAFTGALDDLHDPDFTELKFLEMARSRVYGILAGYEDQNDHDTLGTAAVSNGSQIAQRILVNWPGSLRLLFTSLRMKREEPRRRGSES